MSPNRIRIPTRNAPAGHHLTFICAVSELAHRVLENVTGLDVDLQVSIHNHTNAEREQALTAAAREAGLPYRRGSTSAWHFWQNQQGVRVTLFTALDLLCDFDDCDQIALPNHDFCATHQAEHEENMAACEQMEPESTTELAQIITNEFEASNPELRAQVAYYDWTNDGEAVLRQEG